MTNNLIIFDMMSVGDHSNLNNFYLESLSDLEFDFYISSDLHDLYPTVRCIKPLGTVPCGSGLIERTLLAWKVLSILVSSRAQVALFLSYDLVTFPIISRVCSLLGVNVVCFEHNTAPTTSARRIIQKLIESSVVRLVFAKHIQKMYLLSGIDTVFIPHPCVRSQLTSSNLSEWDDLIENKLGWKSDYSKVAFCPSGSIRKDVIESVARLYPKTLFIYKSSSYSQVENVICKKYFDNYALFMSECDFLGAFFTHDSKVSGPVFEAIAFNKPVMLLDNDFGRHVKSLFPDLSFFCGEEIPNRRANISLDDYNKAISDGLRSNLVPHLV